MNLTFPDYVHALGIESLSEGDQIAALAAFARAVHNQFLLDLYDSVGLDHFNAIKTSIKLGPALYITTLKHLAPNYLDLYETSKKKVLDKMKEVPTT